MFLHRDRLRLVNSLFARNAVPKLVRRVRRLSMQTIIVSENRKLNKFRMRSEPMSERVSSDNGKTREKENLQRLCVSLNAEST